MTAGAPKAAEVKPLTRRQLKALGVERIQVVELRPGDVVVLNVRTWVSTEAMIKLIEQMQRAFPGVRAIVLEPDIELKVCRASELPPSGGVL